MEEKMKRLKTHEMKIYVIGTKINRNRRKRRHNKLKLN